MIQEITLNEEADQDKSFRASSPLLFNVSNSQYSNIYKSNMPHINAQYSDMNDDGSNNIISLNYDTLKT